MSCNVMQIPPFLLRNQLDWNLANWEATVSGINSGVFLSNNSVVARTQIR